MYFVTLIGLYKMSNELIRGRANLSAAIRNSPFVITYTDRPMAFTELTLIGAPTWEMLFQTEQFNKVT